MSKRLFVTIAFLLCLRSANAADGEYAVSKIDSGLLKNADVVKRNEEIRYEVISLTKTRLYRKYAITVMDENGDDFSYLFVHYDKLRTVKSIEGKLFDRNGKEIKSLKGKDIEDRSNVSGISLMEDSRIKMHNFFYKVYPYTVEYETVIEFNNTFMIYPWMPQPTEKYAIEKSSISVVSPSWFTFQYKMFNYKGEPVISNIKEDKIFKWEVKHLPAVLNEYADPDWQYLTTCVYFKPDKFEFEGYKGSMISWKELGEFQLELNQGRDKLPEAVKLQVHQLTDGITDTKEKTRLLYEFMQKNTRYISVQLGIGGYQPFDAGYVAKNAYGDCKALSNFMYSLLKEVNIKSCYTLIKSGVGEYFFMPDFSTDQFDHIILCVPMVEDSMWLECTSQTLPAGYLGGFTCNRFALLVDETGGHLVHTPKYGINVNLETRHVNAKLNEDATLLMNSTTTYGGLQQDNYRRLLNELSKDKVKEVLHEQLDFATYEIKDFRYKENKSSLPTIVESLDIAVSNYATITGKRLFIVPNIMTRTSRKLSEKTERRHDLELGFEFKDIDTVEISLPNGYLPEAIPQDAKIESRFGKYNASVKISENRITYYRSYEHYSGYFPYKEYDELVKFYEAIYKADRNKIVLVKNEQPAKGF
ncbi:MAG: DUF3857 domain-containing protein [Bacteroidota bacterium]